MTRLVLHIDHLVLRGLQSGDTRELSLAVQAELSRLLAQPGTAAALANGGDRARIRVPAMRLPAMADSQSLGHAIAGSLDGGLRS